VTSPPLVPLSTNVERGKQEGEVKSSTELKLGAGLDQIREDRGRGTPI